MKTVIKFIGMTLVLANLLFGIYLMIAMLQLGLYVLAGVSGFASVLAIYALLLSLKL